MKKIKIIYLTHGLSANSETFIQNTIKQIMKLEDFEINLFTLEYGENYLFKNNFYHKCYLVLVKLKLNRLRFHLLDKLFNSQYSLVFMDFGKKLQLSIRFGGISITANVCALCCGKRRLQPEKLCPAIA